MGGNKTIAKNTFLLYFRMMFTMLITLYTSRVVLQVLGVDDFGIYQAVGGIVVMLSFVNGALSSGSSRFLTFELGRGDFSRLTRTFSSTLSIHILLALVICLFAETIGLWFVSNKLGIAPERMDAVLWVYHFSVLASFATIIQVPYTASIIAHEKMSVYAYITIFEVIAKLLLVYLLELGDWDKLKLYATLICCIQISTAIFYAIYCVRHFKETKYKVLIDKTILKEVFNFSGWSLFAASSIALNAQGTTIITSMFFGPVVVTARAISIQVNMAANQLVSNFRIAVNPQIIKMYAIGNYEGSKKLLLSSTIFSYYLMLILGLPIIFVAEPLVKLWLGIVPEYTVIFIQLIIVESLFSVFDTSFYTALYAKGRLKENALISPLLGFIRFPIVYILFKMGYSPVALSYAGIVTYALLGLVIKPYLVHKIVDYTFKDIISVYFPCFKVTLVAIILPLTYYHYYDKTIIGSIVMIGLSVISVLLSVYYFGLEREFRKKILYTLKEKLLTNKDRV